MQQAQRKYGAGMTAAACLWLGLFPLLAFGGYARVTLGKWILMLVLLGVTLPCFAADAFTRRLSRPRLLPALLGCALLGWTLLSFFLSPYPKEALLLGTSSRREGLYSQLCYFSLFGLFAFSRVRFRPVLYAAFGGLLGFAAVVVLQRAGFNPFGLYPPGYSYASNYEFQGTIGNIDMDTGYLLMLSGLFAFSLAGALPRRREKAPSGAGQIAWLPFWVSLAGLCFSVSLIVTMDVQFGLVTLAALALFMLLRFLPRRLRVPVLLLLLAAVFLLVWFWPGTNGGLWELHEILHGRGELSFGSNRAAVWVWSLRMSLDRFFLGTGPDSFNLRFNQYLKTEGLVVPQSQNGVLLPTHFDNPHNEYIAQLVYGGLPALLLFAGLLFFAMARSGARGKKAAPRLWTGAVFCYAVQAFFSFSVCLVAPLFWVLLGLCAQDFPLTGPGTASPPEPSPAL